MIVAHFFVCCTDRRGIKIGYCPDAVTSTTADMCLALLLNIARRVNEGDQLVHRYETKENINSKYIMSLICIIMLDSIVVVGNTHLIHIICVVVKLLVQQ
jgi:lactate dehydrogenase-like 2-hydroxyacid dehydrogenase